jgi:hypothetical protein
MGRAQRVVREVRREVVQGVVAQARRCPELGEDGVPRSVSRSTRPMLFTTSARACSPYAAAARAQA